MMCEVGFTDEEIDRAQARLERLFGKDWLMEGMLDDPSKDGLFRYHRCWKCNDGAQPCVQGQPSRCEYPKARND